jgi:hypothetical protein
VDLEWPSSCWRLICGEWYDSSVFLDWRRWMAGSEFGSRLDSVHRPDLSELRRCLAGEIWWNTRCGIDFVSWILNIYNEYKRGVGESKESRIRVLTRIRVA